MATVRKTPPPEPSDAGTVLRDLRKVLEKHGWVATASGVDSDGALSIAGRIKPTADERTA